MPQLLLPKLRCSPSLPQPLACSPGSGCQRSPALLQLRCRAEGRWCFSWCWGWKWPADSLGAGLNAPALPGEVAEGSKGTCLVPRGLQSLHHRVAIACSPVVVTGGPPACHPCCGSPCLGKERFQHCPDRSRSRSASGVLGLPRAPGQLGSAPRWLWWLSRPAAGAVGDTADRDSGIWGGPSAGL